MSILVTIAFICESLTIKTSCCTRFIVNSIMLDAYNCSNTVRIAISIEKGGKKRKKRFIRNVHVRSWSHILQTCHCTDLRLRLLILGPSIPYYEGIQMIAGLAVYFQVIDRSLYWTVVCSLINCTRT